MAQNDKIADLLLNLRQSMAKRGIVMRNIQDEMKEVAQSEGSVMYHNQGFNNTETQHDDNNPGLDSLPSFNSIPSSFFMPNLNQHL